MNNLNCSCCRVVFGRPLRDLCRYGGHWSVTGRFARSAAWLGRAARLLAERVGADLGRTRSQRRLRRDRRPSRIYTFESAGRSVRDTVLSLFCCRTRAVCPLYYACLDKASRRQIRPREKVPTLVAANTGPGVCFDTKVPRWCACARDSREDFSLSLSLSSRASLLSRASRRARAVPLCGLSSVVSRRADSAKKERRKHTRPKPLSLSLRRRTCLFRW